MNLNSLKTSIKTLFSKPISPDSGAKLMPYEKQPATQLGAVVYGEVAGRGQYPKLTIEQMKEDMRKVINVAMNRQRSGDVNSYGGPTLTSVLNKKNQFQAVNGNLYKQYIENIQSSNKSEQEKLQAVKEVVKEWQEAIRSKYWKDNTAGAKSFTTDKTTGRVMTK